MHQNCDVPHARPHPPERTSLWVDSGKGIRKFMIVKHGPSKREAWIKRARIDRKVCDSIVQCVPAPHDNPERRAYTEKTIRTIGSARRSKCRRPLKAKTLGNLYPLSWLRLLIDLCTFRVQILRKPFHDWHWLWFSSVLPRGVQSVATIQWDRNFMSLWWCLALS